MYKQIYAKRTTTKKTYVSVFESLILPVDVLYILHNLGHIHTWCHRAHLVAGTWTGQRGTLCKISSYFCAGTAGRRRILVCTCC